MGRNGLAIVRISGARNVQGQGLTGWGGGTQVSATLAAWGGNQLFKPGVPASLLENLGPLIAQSVMAVHARAIGTAKGMGTTAAQGLGARTARRSRSVAAALGRGKYGETGMHGNGEAQGAGVQEGAGTGSEPRGGKAKEKAGGMIGAIMRPVGGGEPRGTGPQGSPQVFSQGHAEFFGNGFGAAFEEGLKVLRGVSLEVGRRHPDVASQTLKSSLREGHCSL